MDRAHFGPLQSIGLRVKSSGFNMFQLVSWCFMWVCLENRVPQNSGASTTISVQSHVILFIAFSRLVMPIIHHHSVSARSSLNSADSFPEELC